MEAVENIEKVIAADKTLLQNIKFEKVVEHKSWLKIIADAYENDNINNELNKKNPADRKLKELNEIAQKKVGLREEDASAIFSKLLY